MAVGVVISTSGQRNWEEATTTTEEGNGRVVEIEAPGRKSPICMLIGATCRPSSTISYVAGSGRCRSAITTGVRPICSLVSASADGSFSSGVPMGRCSAACPTMVSFTARPPCRRRGPCICP